MTAKNDGGYATTAAINVIEPSKEDIANQDLVDGDESELILNDNEKAWDEEIGLVRAPAAVQDDLITIRKPTTRAEMLWLLKLAHLVISDVNKTLEETFAPAQESFTAADMATAAAQGFRDGVASLSANTGEPFGWVKQSEIDASKTMRKRVVS